MTHEIYIEEVEAANGISSATRDAASDALAFVMSLHSLYVDQGVLNSDAPVDVAVLEALVDAFHGELAAAAIFLSEDSFKGLPELLRGTAKTFEKGDMEGVVPTTVRKGFDRLASRVERTRELRKSFVTE